jgi:hypothetical protein
MNLAVMQSVVSNSSNKNPRHKNGEYIGIKIIFSKGTGKIAFHIWTLKRGINQFFCGAKVVLSNDKKCLYELKRCLEKFNNKALQNLLFQKNYD